MNKSETKAKKWLMEKRGYKEGEIVFQRARTPDFLCSDGQSFEVKRLYQNTIWFHNTQAKEIQKEKNCSVLIMADNIEEPVKIISPEQITDGTILDGIRIKVVEKNQMCLPISEELEKRFREAAMKIKGYRRGALKEAMEDAIEFWLDANEKRIAGKAKDEKGGGL